MANLSYLTGTITIRRALEVFREITPFRHLVSLNTREFPPERTGFARSSMAIMEEWDSELTEIAVGPSVDEVLAAIPDEADAVIVYPLLRLVWRI